MILKTVSVNKALRHTSHIQWRRPTRASIALVGVVRITPIIPRHANLWIVPNSCLTLAISQPGHHTRDA
jgi:hypothetical protein